VEAVDEDVSFATVAVDHGGNVHVAWSQASAIWMNRYVLGVGWRGASRLVTDAGGQQLASSATGRAYLAYSKLEGVGAARRAVLKVRQFD
jgi:hypothetical protein